MTTCTRCGQSITRDPSTTAYNWIDERGLDMCGRSAVAGSHVPAR